MNNGTYEEFANGVLSNRRLGFAEDAPSLSGAWLVRFACEHPGASIRLNNASIDGDLDLSDLKLGVLVLEDCRFDGPINLSNAQLTRFSLVGSRIAQVEASGIIVEGSVDFSNVSPRTNSAWINLAGAQIGGGVRGRGAHLAIPERRTPRDVSPWTRIYALRLSSAQLRGGIDLNEGFVAEGGFSLEGAVVQGSVSMRGARLTRCEDDGYHFGDCFSAISAVIDGSLFLNFGVHTEGRLVLIGARIGGTLSLGMQDSHFANATPGTSWQKGQLSAQSTIVLDNATIGAELYVVGATLDAALSMRTTSVGGNAQLGMLEVATKEEGRPELALNVSGLRTGGALLLSRDVRLNGAVLLDDADIGTRLDLTGLEFSTGPGSGSPDLTTVRVGTVTLQPKPSSAGR